MKILIVIDQYDNLSNGTTISAKRFVDGLRKDGNEVQILSTGKDEKDKFGLKTYWFPKVIDKYFKANEMVFAKPDEEVMREVFKNQDVIHFYMPFVLARKGVKIAEEMHIPHTTAFHVQPENITYAVGLGTNQLINDKIYTYFRTYYNKFRHIHCPSKFIANQLENHGYTAKLHVISNGVDEDFKFDRKEKPEELKDKFIITMVGRYSPEKRQDVLIDAIKKSKYSDKIQLILGGKGQCYEKYKEQSKDLKNPPIMQFFEKNDLANGLIEEFESTFNIDIKEYIEEMVVATPFTFERFTNNINGSFFGPMRLGYDNSIHRFISYEEERIPHLSFVGSSSLFGSGVDNAFYSGYYITEKLLEDERRND